MAAAEAETTAETPPSTPMGKRPSLVSRHSSNNSANLSASAQQAKPKPHLVGKRNRSSGQLTKLTKSHSAKNLTKSGLKSAVKFKRTSSHAKFLDIDQPAADGWVEEESSTATTVAKAAGKRPEAHRVLTEPGARAGDDEETDHDDDNTKNDATAITTTTAAARSAHADSPPQPQSQSSMPDQQNHRLPNRNVSFRLQPPMSKKGAESAIPASASGSQKHTLDHRHKRKTSPSGRSSATGAIMAKQRKATQADDSDVSPGSTSSASPTNGKGMGPIAAPLSDRDVHTTTTSTVQSKGKGKQKVFTDSNPPAKQKSSTSEAVKSGHKYSSERDDTQEPHLHSPFDDDIRGSSRSRLTSEDPYDSDSEDQGFQTNAREYTISHDELVKRHKQYREADDPDSETYKRAGVSRSSLEDGSLAHQEQRSSATSQNIESSFEEAGPELAHEPTMSRTQFRLNLERQHTLNFREPRQRPVGWPESVFGERRVENSKAKPSVWRAVREARKDLDNVREQGQDPLKDAIDAVGYKGLGTTKKKDPPKPLPKRSIWAGRRTLPPRPRPKEGPLWEYEARVAVVESLTANCQRLWSTPAVIVDDE